MANYPPSPRVPKMLPAPPKPISLGQPSSPWKGKPGSVPYPVTQFLKRAGIL